MCTETRRYLQQADMTLKLFLTVFLFVLTIGYSIGLFFVNHTTKGTPSGLIEEYRGTPENEESSELKYEKSGTEMYILLHNHILSLSVLFFAVGTIFYFSSAVSDSVKRFLILEPFVALLTTFGGIWLMRYVSPYFNWMVIISGISMAGCYFTMTILIIKELWFGGNE